MDMRTHNRSGLIALFIVIVLVVIAIAIYVLYLSQGDAANNVGPSSETSESAVSLAPQRLPLESDISTSISSDLDSLNVDAVSSDKEFQDVDQDLKSL